MIRTGRWPRVGALTLVGASCLVLAIEKCAECGIRFAGHDGFVLGPGDPAAVAERIVQGRYLEV